MTPVEELTIDALAGAASRRLKFERNFLRFHRDDPLRLAVVEETIKTLDAVRSPR